MRAVSRYTYVSHQAKQWRSFRPARAARKLEKGSQPGCSRLNEVAVDPILVLHIEDDEAVRTSIAVLLKSAGYQVVSAADGPGALELVKAGNLLPDVLIVDFVLPGPMDGTEAAEAICATAEHVIPTIMLSGELANAALPWLPGTPLFCARKPCDPAILVRVVASFATLGRFICSGRQPLRAADTGTPRSALSTE